MTKLGQLRDELHVHLYGCLTATDLLELGRDRLQSHAGRLDWYADEYAKAWGRRPDWRAYWATSSGAEQLRQDFEFVTAEPFARFQACFNLGIALFPALPGDSTVLKHVLRAHAEKGLRHVEYRCFVPPIMSPQDIPRYVTTLARAAAEAERDSGGTFAPRLAFSCARDPSLFSAQYAAIKTAQTDPEVATYVTGIDFCGVEEGNPPRQMRAIMGGVRTDNARNPKTALALLYHVGESWNDKSLASTVRWIHEAHTLGAHRLGHALALGIAADVLTQDRGERAAKESARERRDHLRWLLGQERLLAEHGYAFDRVAVAAEAQRVEAMPPDSTIQITYDAATLADTKSLQDAVLKHLAATGAIIESCLTSNLRIGRIAAAERHPLRRFLDAGVKVTLSTDDPGVFATDLGAEEQLAKISQGVSAAEIQQLSATAEAAQSRHLVR